MFCRKIPIISFLFVVGLSGQSIFNAYGLGLSKSFQHTSSAGASSIGLVPTFHPGVSLDNPATWSGLKFTYISGSYSNREMGIDANNSSNTGGGIEKIQFVIPIRDKYGFGLSIKTVNDHYSYFKTDSISFDFQGKTIQSNKVFRSGGGLMAGTVGLSLPLNEKMAFGLSLDRLFGSSRDEQSLILNDMHYRLFNIRTYSGSTINFNFAGQFFSNNKIMILGFAKVSMTGSPVSGTLYQFDVFEDRNQNFSYDQDDYPATAEVDTINISNIYAPNSFSLGFNVSFKNNMNIFTEFQLWNDEATNANYASIIKEQIGSKTHLGAGMVRFGNLDARSWQDRITLRLGSYKETYGLRYSGKTINENGISLGFGFKFAATGNQLDISYRKGSRSMEGGHKEIIKDFTIGLSLGDVWFLRRRAKQ